MQFASCLEQYYFERYILDVSIATLERGGVTSKVDSYQFLEPIDAWGLPKHPARTVILKPEIDLKVELVRFIERNETCLREADAWLGTWIHPTTGFYYLDVTLICADLEIAKREASKRSKREAREIVAVYNFLHKETVFL